MPTTATSPIRIASAGAAAFAIVLALGPPGSANIFAALGLAILVALGGFVQGRTDALSATGRIANGAVGVLLLIPAIAMRVTQEGRALSAISSAPVHDAVSRLPQIAAEVPVATGPILFGAGAAILVLSGRMGSAIAGAIFGAAMAAEAGRTVANLIHRSLTTENYGDAVLWSQSLRFLWLLAIVGLLAGLVFVRKARTRLVGKRMMRLRSRRIEEIKRERERIQNEIKRIASEAVEAEATAAAEQAALDTETAEEDTESNPFVGAPGVDKSTNIDLDGLEDPDLEPTAGDLPRQVPAEEELTEGMDLDLDDLAENEADENIEPQQEEIIVHISPDEVEPDSAQPPAMRKRQGRISAGLAVLVTVASSWTASPPWWSVVRALPSPATGITVPAAEPGLPTAQRPMQPLRPDFGAALQARGHKPAHGPAWPCLPDTYAANSAYGSHPRPTETMAVAADTLVTSLYEPVTAMRRRGVLRMGLTGAADAPFGPLGAFLAWPSIQLLLDRPPRTLQWYKLFPRSIEKLPLLPGATQPAACALAIQEGLTIAQLYSTVRSLSSPFGEPSCQRAVVLVFPDDSPTKNPHPGWRGCP